MIESNALDPQSVLTSVAADLTADDGYRDYYWKVQGFRLRETLRLFVELASSGSVARILDVGSNPPFLLATLGRLKYDCLGIDLQPEVIKPVTDKYALTIQKVDIENELLPFEDNSFDVVVFTEVFEHLRINPIRTVSELHRILKPGGRLILSTPNLYSINGIYKLLVRGTAYAVANEPLYDQFDYLNRVGYFGHIREYTWQEVTEFLRRIGFKTIKPYFLGGGMSFRMLKPLYWFFPSLKPTAHYIATK